MTSSTSDVWRHFIKADGKKTVHSVIAAMRLQLRIPYSYIIWSIITELKESYISITAHWLDCDLKLQQAVLTTAEMSERHTAN